MHLARGLVRNRHALSFVHPGLALTHVGVSMPRYTQTFIRVTRSNFIYN